ncbi:hypothetical protein [Plantactinospora sp. GCM10030261]|uniref:hypothetical protein n=1 Tax=Plantactinospora sp. GCM10030261 TaxID=3273420 RepID=UPI00361C003D
MTQYEISVDTAGVRDAAAALTGTAHRLGYGLAGCPGLTVPSAGAAGSALAALVTAVSGWLAGVGVATAAAADAARTAADGYDAADDRAAGRLGGRR